jgi:hypothetical protein
VKTAVYRMTVSAVGGGRRQAVQYRQLGMLSLHRPGQRYEYAHVLPVRQVQSCYFPFHSERNRRLKLSPWNGMSVPLCQRLECSSLLAALLRARAQQD